MYVTTIPSARRRRRASEISTVTADAATAQIGDGGDEDVGVVPRRFVRHAFEGEVAGDEKGRFDGRLRRNRSRFRRRFLPILVPRLAVLVLAPRADGSEQQHVAHCSSHSIATNWHVPD